MTIYYLELSNIEKGEHKFYEINTRELEYTVRYGRIGTDGQSKVHTFDAHESMQKSVDKTLAEKIKKGYQHATQGQTAKQETQHQTILRLVKTLFSLISNGNQAVAKECYSRFKEEIEEEENKEEYQDGVLGLIENGIRESADWELIFFVDWKDTESMLGALDALCENSGLDIQFDWGCENPEDDLDVPQIILLAHAQLQKIGYALWHWDMGCDDYEGWIARDADAPQIAEIVTQLGIKAGYPN